MRRLRRWGARGNRWYVHREPVQWYWCAHQYGSRTEWRHFDTWREAMAYALYMARASSTRRWRDGA